jgi:hypothetical protein
MYLYPGTPMYEQVAAAFRDHDECAICLGFVWHMETSDGEVFFIAVDIAPQTGINDTSDMDLSRWLEDHLQSDEDGFDESEIVRVWR